MYDRYELERDDASDYDAYDVGEAFGDHDIEYWIYGGRRLVPASPDEAERLREMEARVRLESRKSDEQRHQRLAMGAPARAWFREKIAALGAQFHRRVSPKLDWAASPASGGVTEGSHRGGACF